MKIENKKNQHNRLNTKNIYISFVHLHVNVTIIQDQRTVNMLLTLSAHRGLLDSYSKSTFICMGFEAIAHQPIQWTMRHHTLPIQVLFYFFQNKVAESRSEMPLEYPFIPFKRL